jgi:hypothetical protein
MKKLLTGLVLSLAFAFPAFAGMIETPAAPSQQQTQRERVLQLVERPEVAKQLEKMGISADRAKDRVAAMSDEEVAMVAGKLDSLPAGGELSNQDFLFLIIILLVVILIVSL